jgi:hypothetical protein
MILYEKDLFYMLSILGGVIFDFDRTRNSKFRKSTQPRESRKSKKTG